MDTNGCEASAMVFITPNLCIGINEYRKSTTELIAYPNPNKGEFTIRATSELKLSLNNELGQRIRSIHLTSSTDYTAVLNDLPNGVYFISGEKESHIKNQKIIVLH